MAGADVGGGWLESSDDIPIDKISTVGSLGGGKPVSNDSMNGVVTPRIGSAIAFARSSLSTP